MKKFICYILLITFILSLTACGTVQNSGTNTQQTLSKTQSASTETKAATDTGKKIKLTVLSPYQEGVDLSYELYWHDMMKEWLQAHPNVELDNQGFGDFSVFYERRKAAFASNDIPNLLYNTGFLDLYEYVKGDYIVNLKPYFDSDKQWYDSFYESMFEGGTFNGKDGIYAIPFIGQVGGLFINKSLLADAGITKYPETMDDWAATCEAIKAKGDVVPHAMAGKVGYFYAYFFSSMLSKRVGPNWVSKINKGEVKYTDPEPLEVLKLLKSYYDKGYFGKNVVDIDEEGMRNSVYNMKAAMMQSNAWAISVMMEQSKDKSQIGYAAFPYFSQYPQYKDCYLAGVGDHFSVCNTGNKEAQDLAVDFLKYVTRKDNYAKNMKAQGYANLSVIKGIDVPGDLPPMVKDFNDSLKGMKSSNRPGLHDTWGAEAGSVELQSFQDVMLGDLKPEDALKKIQDAIEKAIKSNQ